MKKLLVLGFFTLISVVVTWPLILHLNNFIIDPHDGLLITWFLNWSLGHPLNYNANIFYPYQNTLAFSETMFPQALIAAPFVLLTAEPLVTYNINVLLGFVLTAFACYLLISYLTKSDPAAILGATIFTFSTIHLNYLAHLQLFDFWPVIFAIYFLLREKFKLFVLFFLISSLTTILNLYFLLAVICLIFLFNFVKRRSLVLYTIISVLLVAPFLFPYYLVTRQFQNIRPINDAINNSLQFPDLLNVSVYSRLSAFFPQQSGTPAYFGAVFLGMILLAFRKFKISIWWWLAGLSFILALGPALHIFRNTVHIGPIPAIPLPYAIFYYLLPGFAGLRTPSRWILLTAFALSVAVVVYFAKRITWKWAVILSLLVILEVNFPFQYTQVPSVREFPQEQVWLKDNYPGAPIIQFPIYAWFDGDNIGTETLREYYSTIHYHPMVNGYSGFSPREWEEKVKWLQKNFPDGETVGYLRNLGIRLILVPVDWDVTSVQNELELVASFPQTNVYTLNNRSQD